MIIYVFSCNILIAAANPTTSLRVSELMVSPFRTSDLEKDLGFNDPFLFQYIEIQNILEDESILMDGVQIRGDVKFDFPDGPPPAPLLPHLTFILTIFYIINFLFAFSQTTA